MSVGIISGLHFYAIGKGDDLMYSCEAGSPIDAMLSMIEQLYTLASEEVGDCYPEANQWVSNKLGLLSDYKVFEIFVDKNKFNDLLGAESINDLKPYIKPCETT
ncbi:MULTISPECIES: hypothetical protein [Methylophaga]|uniref:hypothetical protein n=1 Tax=Methylophaga TaxID=40222 RepID=UPI000CDCA0B7|nr:hypothetical protein [Methylophaga nitratireducenticrescens]AUZ86115.1 hypothetical protein CDW43_15805 [Methylophaga nitratireducenticrescens]